MRISTLAYPLAAGPRGSLDTVSGTDRALQGAALFFLTPQGTRPLVPEFGYPPLPQAAGLVPAWNRDVEMMLPQMVYGVARAQVRAALEPDGTLRAQVQLRLDGGEELNYDVEIR